MFSGKDFCLLTVFYKSIPHHEKCSSFLFLNSPWVQDKSDGLARVANSASKNDIF